MMRMTYVINACAMVALIVYGPVFAQDGERRPPTSPVTGDAVKGKKFYFDYACYSCHGYSGETGARRFVPTWPATLASEASFIAFLRGRANAAPVQPSTSMPNYAAQSLSDASAKDIYAYIRTFKSNAPPADQIEVFKQILGSAQNDRSAATPK